MVAVLKGNVVTQRAAVGSFGLALANFDPSRHFPGHMVTVYASIIPRMDMIFLRSVRVTWRECSVKYSPHLDRHFLA